MPDTLAAYRADALPRDRLPPHPDSPALPQPTLFDARTMRAVFALLSSAAIQVIYRAAGEDLHSRALEDHGRPAPALAIVATSAAAPIATKAKPAAKPKAPIRNPGTTRLPKARRAARSAVRHTVAALADVVGGTPAIA